MDENQGILIGICFFYLKNMEFLNVFHPSIRII